MHQSGHYMNNTRPGTAMTYLIQSILLTAIAHVFLKIHEGTPDDIYYAFWSSFSAMAAIIASFNNLRNQL